VPRSGHHQHHDDIYGAWPTSLTSTCVTSYGFLEAEKNFRRKQGHRELWVLATALERKVESTANAKGKVA